MLPSNLNRRSPYARQIEHTGRGLRLTAASKAGLPRGREANGSPVPARSGMPAPPCQWPGVADRLPIDEPPIKRTDSAKAAGPGPPRLGILELPVPACIAARDPPDWASVTVGALPV